MVIDCVGIPSKMFFFFFFCQNEGQLVHCRFWFLLYVLYVCMSSAIYVLLMVLDTYLYLMSICVFYLCQLLLLTTKCLLMLGHLLIFKLFRPTPQICLSGLAKHSNTDSCLYHVIIVIILCLCFPYFRLAGVWQAGSETKMKQTWASCGAAVIQRHF